MAGGVLLVICLGHAAYGGLAFARTRGLTTWGFVFGLMGAVTLAASLSLISIRFDRYLLAIIPWLAFSVSLALPTAHDVTVRRWSLAVSGVFLAGMAGYSIVNQHNHMAEKRVWAAAIDELVAQGIPRENIDAGWVFNGEKAYGRFGDMRSYQWYSKRDYTVGFRLGNDYPVLHNYPVPRWPIWGSTGPEIGVYGPKSAPR